MEMMPKEGEILKRVAMTCIFLGVGFTLQQSTNVYLHIAMDVASVFLLLAFHLALAGYILAFDNNHSKIMTAYSALSCGFVAVAVPAKVGGFNLPFSTKPIGVYHWVMTAVVAMIYSPIIVKACKVIHSLMTTHTIISSSALAEPINENPFDGHMLTSIVGIPHPSVSYDDSNDTIVDVEASIMLATDTPPQAVSDDDFDASVVDMEASMQV